MGNTMAHDEAARVTVGVDTHRDQHVAVALDQLGRRLGVTAVATTTAGYRELLRWASAWGEIDGFGIEGTGCYGAGLARWLRSHGVAVTEVIRPNRQQRRRNGKSDPADAESAARAVLSGEAASVPKAGDDCVEMIRVLRIARTGAIKARTQAINAMRAVIVTAPPSLRQQFRSLPAAQLIAGAARLRPGADTTTMSANKQALRCLASRCEALDVELAVLDARLERLVDRVAPTLMDMFGVGTDTAGALLVSVGDNPERVTSESAAAKLWGSAPVECSSGQTTRHRLNRGGDRQANAALYRIVLVRMRWHQPTKDYIERRTHDGKSKPEIIRCLKRYLTREVYAALITDASTRTST